MEYTAAAQLFLRLHLSLIRATLLFSPFRIIVSQPNVPKRGVTKLEEDLTTLI